jgi:glutaminyl-tRNA synthetase
MEEPPAGYHRLKPGGEVRLKGAYFIRCNEIVKDPATGEPSELRCTYDPETKSGSGFSGRKVKGTIHWVSAEHAVSANVNLYDRLLLDEALPPKEEEADWTKLINPDSLIRLEGAKLEPFAMQGDAGEQLQFFRHGYFVADAQSAEEGRLAFNRIVPFKDSWNAKA